MTDITITNIKDLRPGDYATFAYREHRFSGEVWANSCADLCLGSSIVWFSHDEGPHDYDFISATRPALPSSPGTVLEATVRGVPGVRVMRQSEHGRPWRSAVSANEYWTHFDKDITDWTVLLEGIEE